MFIGLTFNMRSEPKGKGRAGDLLTDDAEEEFDSPETIHALADGIRGLGHEVELLGDGEPMLRRLLDGRRPDFVFNFAEGIGIGRSREARVPAVLEMLGIPYTGSDPMTLAVTLDKECAKRLVRDAGVPTPAWILIDDASLQGEERKRTESALAALPLPVIVKPAFEGSSKGVFNSNLIQDRERLLTTVTQLHSQYRQPILVEEFIAGEELTVGLVGNPPKIIGIMRVVPNQPNKQFVYSLEVKRDWENQVRYECPAALSANDTASVRRESIAAWKVLGCRDLARIDFRLRDGVPYFLEVNPLPGLNPQSSDMVLMTRLQGGNYEALLSQIIQAATIRIFGDQAS